MSISKKHFLSPPQLAAVSRLFSAFCEPNRLALLQALQEKPLTVSQLMETCGLRQANVSRHLALLHELKLVKRTRVGTTVVYEIADPLVFSLCELVCRKMEKDAEAAAQLFHADKPR
jgi:DNA-binding transcriptional ArsR family regulator